MCFGEGNVDCFPLKTMIPDKIKTFFKRAFGDKDVYQLGIIILLAFLVRWYYCSLRTVFDNWDSTAYIWLAQNIHEGHGLRLWPGGPVHTWFQPLYPCFISLAYPLFHNYEQAAYFVSALGGSLLIIPAFLLTRLLFSREAAYLIAIIFVFQYRLVEMSSSVLSEIPYCFFWLFGLYFAFRVLVYGKYAMKEFFFCGLFLGIASLIRTESNFDFLLVFVIACVQLVWKYFRAGGGAAGAVGDPGVRARGEDAAGAANAGGNAEAGAGAGAGVNFLRVLILGLAYLVCIGPYAFFLYEQMGVLTFTGRTTHSVFIVMEAEGDVYEFYDGSPISYVIRTPLKAFRRVVDNDEYIFRKLSIWAFHPVMTFFMGLGVFGNPWTGRDLRKMGLFFLFLLFPWLTYYGVTGILNRYYTTSIILVLLLVANGLVYCYQWFERSEFRKGYAAGFLSTRKFMYSLLLLLFLLINIRPLVYPINLGKFPDHGDQVKDLAIAGWIRGNLPKDHPSVLCVSPRIAYYCNGIFYGDSDKKMDIAGLGDFIKKNRIDIVVVDDLFTGQWFPALKVLGDPGSAPAYLKFLHKIHYRYDTAVEGDALIYQAIN